MLFVLPLEKLEERYTGQWYRWFQDELIKKNIPYQYVDGQQLTSKVETGVVLDAAGTNYWKFSQMMKVCQLFKEGKVQNGDKFFIMDLWYPSLEAIPYMAQLFNLQVDVYGFLHAGSYTTEDFAEPMSPWAKYFERGWAKLCKGIFVGSSYHKEKFLKKRFMRPDDRWFNIFSHIPLEDYQEIRDKIHVTGNPFNTKEFYSQVDNIIPLEDRGKTIVYSHRFDIEKRPNVFMDIMDELWSKRQDFKVIITTSREKFRSNCSELVNRLYNSKWNFEVKEGLTKAQYYRILASSRIFVSTTIEENFGYCLLEALTGGCIPVVSNLYSHPEILQYNQDFLVGANNSMVERINYYLDSDIEVPTEYAECYNQSIEKIIEVMYGN